MKIQNTVKFNTYALIFDTLFEKVMGNKDKTRDENAATSTDARDRDQESRDAALARIIAEAVAQQTKTITETFQRQMDKMPCTV